ncbi:hypothetical protein YB2330_006586 [Saitoella coloradoensis]
MLRNFTATKTVRTRSFVRPGPQILYRSSARRFNTYENNASPKPTEEHTPLRSRTSFTNSLWSTRLQAMRQAEESTKRKLIPKRMAESYVEGVLPFSSDADMREDYQNTWGGLRLGKLFEDLDALSGMIAYRHCEDGDVHTLPLRIVTASVDRIDLLNPLTADKDLKLSGHVAYVGKSSMNITIRVEELPEDGDASKSTPILLSNFTMVARDPLTNKPVSINPLHVESEKEKLIGSLGNETRKRASYHRSHALSREPPTQEEVARIHSVWLGQEHLDSMTHDPFHVQPSRSPDQVTPAETALRRVNICHPQERNIHNNVFGGYLMRESFDLAHATATLFAHARPIFTSSSSIAFQKPVPIGSILDFHSRVVYSNVDRGSFSVSVSAEVIDPLTGERQTTCVFHYAFRVKDEKKDTLKRIAAVNYGDAMRSVMALRREQESGGAEKERQFEEFEKGRFDPKA